MYFNILCRNANGSIQEIHSRSVANSNTNDSCQSDSSRANRRRVDGYKYNADHKTKSDNNQAEVGL